MAEGIRLALQVCWHSRMRTSVELVRRHGVVALTCPHFLAKTGSSISWDTNVLMGTKRTLRVEFCKSTLRERERE